MKQVVEMELKSMEAKKLVLVAGASGLVGQAFFRMLIKSAGPKGVLPVSIGRRPPSVDVSQLSSFKYVTYDFENGDLFEKIRSELSPNLGVSESLKATTEAVAVCCLGTTIKKAGGSQEAFRKIDEEAVLKFAEASKKLGIQRFLVISAQGADADSRIFYNRVKGSMEKRLMALGFRSLVILRPSLLLGKRAESRPTEAFFIKISPLVSPLIPRRYRPIPAEKVAECLFEMTFSSTAGTHVLESDAIQWR